MKRAIAFGGIFYKVKNPKKTREWYAKHLGFNIDEYGTSFQNVHTENPTGIGYTVWSPFKNDTSYFSPSNASFMINFKVKNLEKLVQVLKEEGVTILDNIEVFEYGKFVHILDIDGIKIELWESDDTEYQKILTAITP